MSNESYVKLFDLLFERSVHLPTAHLLPTLDDAEYAVQTIVNLDNSKRGVPFAFEFPPRSFNAERYVIVGGVWGHMTLPCLGTGENRIVRPLVVGTNYHHLADDPYDTSGVEDSPFPEIAEQIASGLLLGLPIAVLIEILDSASVKQLSGCDDEEKLHEELSGFLGITIHRLNGGRHLYIAPPKKGEYP